MEKIHRELCWALIWLLTLVEMVDRDENTLNINWSQRIKKVLLMSTSLDEYDLHIVACVNEISTCEFKKPKRNSKSGFLIKAWTSLCLIVFKQNGQSIFEIVLCLSIEWLHFVDYLWAFDQIHSRQTLLRDNGDDLAIMDLRFHTKVQSIPEKIQHSIEFWITIWEVGITIF